MEVTDRDRACFEAGIKLGAMYHQFVGTPVSVDTAAGLERAMADMMERQPGCQQARVTLDREAIAAGENRHGYSELAGEYISAAATIELEDVRVRAVLHVEDGYPQMSLEAIDTL